MKGQLLKREPSENPRQTTKQSKNLAPEEIIVGESPVINLTSSSRESSNKQAVVSASLDTVQFFIRD